MIDSYAKNRAKDDKTDFKSISIEKLLQNEILEMGKMMFRQHNIKFYDPRFGVPEISAFSQKFIFSLIQEKIPEIF